MQQRLLAAAKPETQAEIRRVLAKVSHEVGTAKSRDYAAAERTVEALHQQGKLNEAALVDFAKPANTRRRSPRCRGFASVPIDVVDRLMGGDRPDPILILCKSAGWEWPTVKTLIMARPGGKGTSSPGARQRLHQFRTAVAGHRAARDAVLAGAAGAAIGASQLITFSAAERSGSRERGPRAWPWPRSASR